MRDLGIILPFDAYEADVLRTLGGSASLPLFLVELFLPTTRSPYPFTDSFPKNSRGILGISFPRKEDSLVSFRQVASRMNCKQLVAIAFEPKLVHLEFLKQRSFYFVKLGMRALEALKSKESAPSAPNLE
ncbi:hypothetical protein CR513_56241, partial [Mucuna pruriens]